MVTVETVCVVDLRENSPPGGAGSRDQGGPGGGAVGSAALMAALEDPTAPLPHGAASQLTSGSGGGRAPVFAMSVLPGELSASVIGSAGGGGARGGRGDKHAERLKKEMTARRRAEKRARDLDDRRWE